MASEQLAEVQFSTMYKIDDPRHAIGVTGSGAHLGCWDPAKAILLKQRGDSGQWVGGIQLPTNEYMEWKLILLDMPSKRAIRWEEQENRSLCIKSNPTNIVVPWNHRGIIVAMGKHTDAVPQKTGVEKQPVAPLEDRNSKGDKVSPAKEGKSIAVGVAKRFEVISPNTRNDTKNLPADSHKYSTVSNGASAMCTGKSAESETSKASMAPNGRSKEAKQQTCDKKKPGIFERYGKYLMLGGSVAATIIATVVFYTLRK